MAENEMTVPNDVLSFSTFGPIPSSVVFYANGNEKILEISVDGMIYKGVLIEDAGEAYQAWLDTMEAIRNGSGL